MTRSVVAVLVLGLAWVRPTAAGEFNRKLNVGDPAPVWAGLPGVDDKKYALADFKDKPVVVLVFTCNSCPIAQDYEDRIVAFAKKHAGPGGRVALVAVNVNTIEEDRLPQMKARAKQKGYPFPYLYDETQTIAKDYGAEYTPEFFVLDKDRKVAYVGAMDDASNAAQAKVNYLESAVTAVLKGEKPSPAETLARGCRVRWERKRR
jgi:peroxiredoxin